MYTCPILGSIVPLFWITGNVSWVLKPKWDLPYSYCGGKCNVHSLRLDLYIREVKIQIIFLLQFCIDTYSVKI